MADATEVKKNEAILADANNQLAILLHVKLAQKQTNIFFSPFSISMAMAMLIRGAKGDTLDEMRKILGFHKLPIEKVHSTFGKLLNILNEKQDSYALAIANALMSHKEFQLLTEFKDDLQKIYQALTMEVDVVEDPEGAVKQVNEWVKKNTQDMIPQVIDSLDPDTVVILLNAIYFKGTWVHQFDVANTRPRVFYNRGCKEQGKEVPMMFQKEKFLFVEKDTYKALEMPYKGENIAMLLLLPSEMNGIRELEGNIGSTFVQSLKEQMEAVEVKVTLPKLHLEYSKELKSVFQELGLNKIFSCEADFGGLSTCGQVKVSEIIHKAVLDVNEEGSEAAAVTAVMIANYCFIHPNEFKADHPFIFIIYDKRSNIILFMGRVEEM